MGNFIPPPPPPSALTERKEIPHIESSDSERELKNAGESIESVSGWEINGRSEIKLESSINNSHTFPMGLRKERMLIKKWPCGTVQQQKP